MKEYTAVRKTSFDTMWHAIFIVDGREAWDRIDEREALRIARQLPPRVPEKNPARLPVRQREAEPGRGDSWPQRETVVDRFVLPVGHMHVLDKSILALDAPGNLCENPT